MIFPQPVVIERCLSNAGCLGFHCDGPRRNPGFRSFVAPPRGYILPSLRDSVSAYPDDQPYPSKLFLGYVNKRPIDVVAGYDADGKTCILITVYQPDLDIWESDHKTMDKYEIILYWSDKDELFIAEVPELPVYTAHGDSREKALQNAEQAIQLWVETAIKQRRSILKYWKERNKSSSYSEKLIKLVRNVD